MEELRQGGIPEGYVRVSVGIEDLEDLKADCLRGLEAARQVG